MVTLEPRAVAAGQDQKAAIELARILDRGKTVRTIVICATVLGGVIAIVVGVVLCREKPPWLVLAVYIIGSLIGPSGVFMVLLRTRKRYIEKHHSRVVRLEKLLDPKRESSEDEVKQSSS